MATASPAQGNTGATATAGFPAAHTPPKTLRGLNKPKCIQCGNVARSRCPYQSCKSCCARAENPCHIPVLKANATFPDKTPASSSPIFNQHSSEPSSAGSSLRAASLRQLSSNFAQFNNVQMPVRAKKPLTRKDAAAINEWRYLKLKEFKERNIELENAAFERYMQNVRLLEEVFSVESLAKEFTENSPFKDSTPTLENAQSAVSEMKLKLRSNEARKENFRKRIQHIVDRGLKKLQKRESKDSFSDPTGPSGIIKRGKLKFLQLESAAMIVDLNEKLSKARNEEDLKSCLELKAQLFDPQAMSIESGEQDTEKSLQQAKDEDCVSVGQGSIHSKPRLFSSVEIDQETLNSVALQFPSLDRIEDVL